MNDEHDNEPSPDAHKDYAALLGQIELFTELDRVILAKLATDLEPQTFPADTVIFRQGDPSESFYLIVRGRIARLVANADGLDTKLHSLGRGEAFGEQSLLMTSPRNATLRTETESEVLRLGRSAFLELVRQEPSVGLGVAATLSRRLASVVSPDAENTGEHLEGSVAPESVAPPQSEMKDAPRLRRWMVWAPLVFALAVIAGSFAVPPPEGLSVAGWRALAVLIAAVPAMAAQTIPEGVLALLMALAYALIGVASSEIVLSGYATQSWLLLVCVLVIGSALASTGLLYRLALLMIGRLKHGYVGQVISLALAGVLIGPAVPNATGRIIIIAPMLRELVEALGYEPKSRGAAGLSMAALIGFGQLAAVFLTSSTTGVLVFAILQGSQTGGVELDWVMWAYYGAPVSLVMFVGLVATILILYRPRTPIGEKAGASSLALQLALLGPPSRNEKIALAVGALMLLGFMTQPLHGVHPSWVAVLAMGALAAGGIVTANTLQRANWSFALLFGILASISVIFSETKLDTWFAGGVVDAVGAFGGSPLLFVTGLAVLCFAISLVVRWQASAPLITIALAPVAPQFGIDPYIVGLVAVIACNGFFFSYQSTTYLALYHGTEGQLFSHLQGARMAIAYAVVTLVALAVSVPVWHAMGLL